MKKAAAAGLLLVVLCGCGDYCELERLDLVAGMAIAPNLLSPTSAYQNW